jgi:predicted CXXCH cytochrome family protein
VLAEDPLAPSPERGPGNFVFLKAPNLNDGVDGLLEPIPGERAGHNINAPGYGLQTDGTYQNAPGGTFPAHNLKCTSCHDPHGNDNFRMLRGAGQNGQGVFQYPAPEAEGLPFGAGQIERNDNHVAYLEGMSLWCGNCHPDYLHNGHGLGSSFAHPTDELLSATVQQTYVLYNGTSDPVGGQAGTAYLAAVPFEDPGNTTGSTLGPSGSSRVMCLSCHRAHATSAPHAGRWDFNIDTLGQDGGVSGSYPIPNPYGDPDQQPLCRKCHDGGKFKSPIESLFSP